MRWLSRPLMHTLTSRLACRHIIYHSRASLNQKLLLHHHPFSPNAKVWKKVLSRLHDHLMRWSSALVASLAAAAAMSDPIEKFPYDAACSTTARTSSISEAACMTLPILGPLKMDHWSTAGRDGLEQIEPPDNYRPRRKFRNNV